MKRRTFLKSISGCACLSLLPGQIYLGSRAQAQDVVQALDLDAQIKLADLALSSAQTGGASYADFRLCRDETEFLLGRETRIEAVDHGFSAGFAVRVLVQGTWGYASSPLATPDEVQRVTQLALEVARSSKVLQTHPFVLENIPNYQDKWEMPMKVDPFLISLDQKVKKILAINQAALQAGANYVTTDFTFVREQKFFASSRGSHLEQTRVRIIPNVEVTVVDKKSGRFVSSNSLAAPRGSGFDYLDSYDFVKEAGELADTARQKLTAKPVAPGVYDLVLDPTHLWLTIHESVGHPTELDRALGWEANFAGTTFVRPDDLGRLKYGSPLMNIQADRSQVGGLSTVGYDDDGVRTQGKEFMIVKEGIFQNFQMAIGQAQLIGQPSSNGCAFADSWAAFPIQRMPNVSLQPNSKTCSKEDLFADVKNGIYIQGNGSWSIDQQRHNFQFGGQRFYEIKNGKLGGMLRDVAYQSSTVPFWNSMDGIGDASTYFLGGAPNCGKGQPEQSAPVSHGCVPARFRQINVLNTGRKGVA